MKRIVESKFVAACAEKIDDCERYAIDDLRGWCASSSTSCVLVGDFDVNLLIQTQFLHIHSSFKIVTDNLNTQANPFLLLRWLDILVSRTTVQVQHRWLVHQNHFSIATKYKKSK